MFIIMILLQAADLEFVIDLLTFCCSFIKGEKAARKLSDVEEENEDEITNSNEEEEEGGEKENENLCNEEAPDSKPKKKRKRKNKDDASPEQPVSKKKNKRNKKNVQGERKRRVSSKIREFSSAWLVLLREFLNEIKYFLRPNKSCQLVEFQS